MYHHAINKLDIVKINYVYRILFTCLYAFEFLLSGNRRHLVKTCSLLSFGREVL